MLYIVCFIEILYLQEIAEEEWLLSLDVETAVQVLLTGQKESQHHTNIIGQTQQLHTFQNDEGTNFSFEVSLPNQGTHRENFKQILTSACTVKEISTGSSSIKEESTGSSSIKEESTGSSSIKEESESTGSSSIKEESTGSSSIKEESAGSSSIKEEFTGSSSIKEESAGSSSIKDESAGSSSIKEESTGSSSIKEESTGSSSIKEESTGLGSIKEASTGSSSIKEASTGSGSIKEASTGSGSIKEASAFNQDSMIENCCFSSGPGKIGLKRNEVNQRSRAMFDNQSHQEDIEGYHTQQPQPIQQPVLAQHANIQPDEQPKVLLQHKQRQQLRHQQLQLQNWSDNDEPKSWVSEKHTFYSEVLKKYSLLILHLQKNVRIHLPERCSPIH